MRSSASGIRSSGSPGDIFEDLAASVNEMITFSRDVVQAEGGATPLADIAVLPTIGTSVDLPHIDDPLERRGREYAMETAQVPHVGGSDAPFAEGRPPAGRPHRWR